MPAAVVEVPRRAAPAAQPADSDSDSAAVEIEAAEESDWSSEARQAVPAARIRRNAAASD